MSLLPKEIEEFKQIYRKEFGVDLNDKEAAKRAEELLAIVSFLLKKEELPDTKKNENIKENN